MGRTPVPRLVRAPDLYAVVDGGADSFRRGVLTDWAAVTVIRVETAADARTLAERIVDSARELPVVAVSTRHRERDPIIDAETLAAACAPLDVHLIETGPATWELTDALPEMFEVYGGAARIWWPGLTTADDPYRHPLIFCWKPEDAAPAQERMLRLLGQRGYSVVESAGQPRSVGIDADTRLPVTARSKTQLDAFAIGDVLDGRVVYATAGGADIEVAPGVIGWAVTRRRVGPVSVGDAVSVRVVGLDRDRGRLEIDLVARVSEPSVPEEPAAQVVVAADEDESLDDELTRARDRIAEIQSAADDVRRQLAADLATARARLIAYTQSELGDIVEGLERELADAQSDAQQLRRQLHETERDRRNAIAEMRRQRDRANEASREARNESRRAGELARQVRGEPAHEDPELEFRHRVALVLDGMGVNPETAMSYVLGTNFLDSVAVIQGLPPNRVTDVTARLVSNRPELINSLDVHALRSSAAGGSPPVVRSDGARAFRLALQQGTPAARRLHYWQLPNGGVELAKVVYHEDFSIS